MYVFEVWNVLEQPRRLINYFILKGYPSAEAVITLLEEARVAQIFTISDIQRFFDKGNLNTNDGSFEVKIKAINVREPNTGKEKVYNYRGFDDKEVGVYNG